MSQSEIDGARSFPVERSASETDEPSLEQLARSIVANVNELKQKNNDLEQRNADLVSALDEARQRLAQAERTREGNAEPPNTALLAALGVIDQIERDIAAWQKDCWQEIRSAYEAGLERSRELHNEMMALLEATRDEATRCQAQREQQMMAILQEARETIQASSAEAVAPAGEPEGNGDSLRALEGQLVARAAERMGGQPRADAIGTGESVTSHKNEIGHGASPLEARPVTEGRQELPGGIVSSPQATETGPSYELVAGPFRNFSMLSAFHQALRQMPGVVEARAQGFDQGRLRLAVSYNDSMPMLERLVELAGFNVRLSAMEDNRLEVLVEKGVLSGES